MGNNKKSAGKNLIVQGSILAVASIVVRLIGILYRIPLTNIVGNEGMGYYSGVPLFLLPCSAVL